MRTKLLASLASLSLLTSLSACAVDPSADPAAAPGAPAAAPAPALSTEEQALAQQGASFLKRQILAIARANITRTDNLAEVEALLRPYVRVLVALSPRLTEAEKLARSVGAWRSLWTDQVFPGVDRSRVFQVVTAAGHYWNLSNVEAGTGINALRGAYAPIPEGLAIRFTKNALLRDTLVGRDGAELIQLAAGIESGAVPLPPSPPFPPVTGKLITYYIDDEIRIVGGENAPLFDDSGNVFLPGEYDQLYVLERQVGEVP